MEAIADKIRDLVVIEPIEKIVEFVTRLYLAEKGTGATQIGGLGIERDLHFTPKKLSEVKKEHQ